jgi:nucleoside-triphosphatase THEP1
MDLCMQQPCALVLFFVDPTAMAKPIETMVTHEGSKHPFVPLPPAPFAAAVYPAKKADRVGLARFVNALKKAKVRVGGLLQEKVLMGQDGMQRVEAVDIATGKRIPINQPTPEKWRNRVCSLDVSALAETTASLRQAIQDEVELIVVEKFGDAERDGEGLTDEVLQAIAAGIPVVIAVPDTNLDIWNDRSGGMGDVLNCDEEELRSWWASVQCENRDSAVNNVDKSFTW